MKLLQGRIVSPVAFCAWLIFVGSQSDRVAAFAPRTPFSSNHGASFNAVKKCPSSLKASTIMTPTGTESSPSSAAAEDQQTGAMVDLSGVAFSGLKGKALSLQPTDFPSLAKVKSIVPEDCFTPDTATSLGYLGVSLAGTAFCTAVGIQMLSLIGSSIWTLPIWTAYAAVTGTVAMGLWVLAHECGHGAFSKNRALQDTVGYILHSFLLVPYFSWQRSHAVHHRYTNHMELGETHVPERKGGAPIEMEGGEPAKTILDSHATREWAMETFGKEDGLKFWGVVQGFLHLVIGWPAYLLIGATGAPVEVRGMTNHFYPDPLTAVTDDNMKHELFPGKWKEKVLKSDIGIAAVVGGLIGWGVSCGWGDVMALYGGPLLVVNAWLVLYTWLQHTDVDVPHFSDNDHTFTRGAFHTIDRPYDKMDPWGLVDFLHHKIGSTHVAHHLDCTIPHYKAQAATDAIKENFPEIYLYEPTPIWEALWRVCKGCTAVKKSGDRWVWDNKGTEDAV